MRNARKHWMRWMAVGAMGLLVGACADQSPTAVDPGLSPEGKPASTLSAANTVASVQLYPSPLSLKLGASSSIVVVARNSAGSILSITGRTVTWSSSNSSVAKVVPGVVTAVGGGTANVKVSVDGVVGTDPVTVTAPNAVAKVQVLSTVSSLKPGASAQFGAAVKNASGIPMAGYTIAWHSSNPAVATVNSLGQVTAVAPGTATIVAKAGGVVGKKSLSVSSTLTLSTHVDVVKQVSSLNAGQRQQLFAMTYKSSGSVIGYGGTWTSSNTGVATVDAAGNVVTKKPGVVKITAKNSSGLTGYAWVIVDKTY